MLEIRLSVRDKNYSNPQLVNLSKLIKLESFIVTVGP